MIVFALLSVVSSYHDTLLGRRLTKSLSLPPHPFTGPPTPSSDETASTTPPRVIPLLPPPSDHARYTRYWTDRSRIYKRASRALSTLTYLELLMEMLARRKGNDRIRWRVVLVIEAIKYVFSSLLPPGEQI
jgi:peroxin-16